MAIFLFPEPEAPNLKTSTQTTQVANATSFTQGIKVAEACECAGLTGAHGSPGGVQPLQSHNEA